MTLTLTSISQPGRGALYIISAGLLFAGANSAVQAAGMWYGVPSPTIAFWQYAAALVAVMPLLAKGSLRSAQPGWHVARIAAAAIGVQFWVAGLAVVPIWQAIALILTSPLFVTIGAMMFLGERVTVPRIAAVVLGGIGGLIILAPWSEAFGIAAVLPVAAAAFWAVASLITKRLSLDETAQNLTVILLLGLLPINAVLTLGSGFAVTPAAWPAVILAGALLALAQFLLARAYGAADAAFLQPFDHLKLPMNVGLGFAVFGFAPPGSMWIGAALMIAATAWLLRCER